MQADDLPRYDDVWSALKDYMQLHGYARHQLESYNNFMEHGLSQIILENSDITNVHGNFSYHTHFTNVTVLRPTVREADGFERAIMPSACR